MYGASFEGSHSRGHHKQNRGRGRRQYIELTAIMGEERKHARDAGFGSPRGSRGPGGPGPGRRGRRHGRRARRGDTRSAILLLLADEPRNGYGLMQEIEERSGGSWRPSPGSVYPALSQLEDEGLVQATEDEGRKAFTLTDEGRARVEADREKMGTPWKTVGGGATSQLNELREASQAFGMAAMQVANTGDDKQLTEAKAIVDEARRNLYRLLAGDTPK